MARVLVTRAEDQAEQTAARLRERGHVPVLAPLGIVMPLPCFLDGAVPACLAATSRNAFVGLAPPPDDWRGAPLVAVGSATAEAARALGFRRVEVADGDARSAARRVLALAPPGGLVTYLAGQPRKPDFELCLREAGQPLQVLETYRVDERAELPEPVIMALRHDQIEAILHFSAASARRCLDALMAAGFVSEGSSARHLALSADVASVLRAAGIPAARIRVAAYPDQDSLLALLETD